MLTATSDKRWDTQPTHRVVTIYDDGSRAITTACSLKRANKFARHEELRIGRTYICGEGAGRRTVTAVVVEAV